ncbi:hypothetical protein G6F22_017692 [Rhizopus arrhizus]|nr:hypothetical protein G6F22_017692 [Rhizopus arrhizus]KAG1242735.1 hypothetical protein G6F68_016062 [Rhizopus microsporus]KAG1386404.1 hypothetical protein G6F58_013843 [Rhizopus delemar]
MNLEQRDVLSVVVAVSMGVVPVLIKLLERVPENRGGMADLPTAEPVAANADDASPPTEPRDKPPSA